MLTKEQTYNLILSDYASLFGVNVSDLGQNIKVDAAIRAAGEYRMSLSNESVMKNGWAGTADAEMLYTYGLGKLERLPTGAIAGVWNCSTVAITGETDSIAEGTEFRKGNYSYTSVGSTVPGETIMLRALTTGVAPDLVVGDELKSTSALKSIGDVVTVTEEVTTPVDAESISDYRADVVDSIKYQPSNGDASSYIIWGQEVSGVKTVYPYAKSGEAGKVRIYVEGESPIIPEQALIDSVIESIKYDDDGVGRCLVNVFPFIDTTNVTAVQKTDVNVTINNGDSSQQALAESAIESYLLGIRPYLPTLNEIRDSSTDTITASALVVALVNNGVTLTDVELSVKPLGGTSQIVTEYKIGDANDPLYYGEVPILETVTINE